MALPWLLLAQEAIGGIGRTKGNLEKLKELKGRGVDVPWHQKHLYPLLGGPAIGGRITENILESKLARTTPNMATRTPAGMGGDAALADTASFYQRQLANQTGAQIAQLNRVAGSANRYAGGAHLQGIADIQEGARGGFQDFLARTALERYLTERKISSAEDIAQAQIEAAQGSGRAQLFGTGISALAMILAQNPEYLEWLWNKGGSALGSGQSSYGASPGLTNAWAGVK